MWTGCPLKERKWAWKRTWVQRVSEPLSDKVVLGDSYIVHGALSRRLFSGVQTFGCRLGQMDLSQKAIRHYFSCSHSLPGRKWYALLKSSPQPGPTKQPEPVAINLTTWKHFKMLHHSWLLTCGSWTPPRAVVLKLFKVSRPLCVRS